MAPQFLQNETQTLICVNEAPSVVAQLKIVNALHFIFIDMNIFFPH